MTQRPTGWPYSAMQTAGQRGSSSSGVSQTLIPMPATAQCTRSWSPESSQRMPATFSPSMRMSFGHTMLGSTSTRVSATATATTIGRSPASAGASGGRRSTETSSASRGAATHSRPRRPRPARWKSVPMTSPSAAPLRASFATSSLVEVVSSSQMTGPATGWVRSASTAPPRTMSGGSRIRYPVAVPSIWAPSRRRVFTCRCMAAREQKSSSASFDPDTLSGASETSFDSTMVRRSSVMRSRERTAPSGHSVLAEPLGLHALGSPLARPLFARRGVRLRPAHDVAVLPLRPLVEQLADVAGVVRLVGDDLADPLGDTRVDRLEAAPVRLERDERALLDGLEQHEHGDDAVEAGRLARAGEDLLDVVQRVDDELAADRDVVRLGGGLERLGAKRPHDLAEVAPVLLLVGGVALELGAQAVVRCDRGEHPELRGPLQLGAAEGVQHLDALLPRQVGQELGVLLGGREDVGGVGGVHSGSLVSGRRRGAARCRGGSARARTSRRAGGRGRPARSGPGHRGGPPPCRSRGRGGSRRAAAPA